MESTSSHIILEQTSHKPISARLAWVISRLSIIIAVVSLATTAYLAMIRNDYRLLITHQTLTPFITIGLSIIGALVSTRRSHNPVGWIFLSIGVLFALVGLTTALIMVGPIGSNMHTWAIWFGSWLWIPAVLIPIAFVPLYYPNGKLSSSKQHFFAWITGFGITLIILVVMLHPGPLVSMGLEPNPFGVPEAVSLLDSMFTLSTVFLAIGVIGSLVTFILRFRHSVSIEREQMKWLVYAIGLQIFMIVLSSTIPLFWPDFQWGMELSIVITNLGILAMAVAAAVAILRYRLYDIDLIIQRTLIYTALMVGIALLYGFIVGSLSVLFQTRGNLLVSLVATGLVAILIQPFRDKLEHLVSRLMYGDRDNPYAVLSGLSLRLEGVLSPDFALPTVVETIANSLKLPYVAIALKQEAGLAVVASHGTEGEAIIQLPLIYQGETIGQLRLLPRSPGETFSLAEMRLLKDISRHIGVTAHSVLLTKDLRRMAEDLQHSREALIKNREEERRRLRRDLHDELGPQLASMKLNMDVARNLILRDPEAADAFLIDLRAQCQSAIADIRRLVYDLRPPALDELGLVGAIREYICQLISQDSLKINLVVQNDLPALPAAVEVAAYRITLEALTNFVRHSQGNNCELNLAIKANQLQIEVRDDGVGFPEDVQLGVGLNSMRERAAELGGVCEIDSQLQMGTRVYAQLPL